MTWGLRLLAVVVVGRPPAQLGRDGTAPGDTSSHSAPPASARSRADFPRSVCNRCGVRAQLAAGREVSFLLQVLLQSSVGVVPRTEVMQLAPKLLHPNASLDSHASHST